MIHFLVVEGKIVNPGEIYEAQIGIDGEFITEIKKHGLRGGRKIEVRGGLIFPGFIDIHTHLREDSSHKWDYKEDFRSGTMAAVHGGVTTVVDMPNTPEPAINLEQIKAKKQLAKNKGLIDIFFCGGVASSNIDTVAEMQKEVQAYKIYLCETTGGLYIPKEMLPKAIKMVEATSKPIVIHCENQSLIEKKKEEEDLKRGNYTEIYSDLRPEEAELSSVKGVLSSISEDYKNKINIAHLSVYSTLNIIEEYRKKKKRGFVHCEVTPHHLFFNKNEVATKKAFLKINPPLRSEKNRELQLNGFKKGQIDFLVSDHAPHTKDEKEKEFLDAPAGVPNLDTYGNFVSWLIVNQNINPKLIARACSYNPAAFLGLKDRGRIEVGKMANLTILDLEKHVKISDDRLYTKCGWSPFEGYEFPGTIKHTIFKGKVMSEYDEVFERG